MKLSNKKTQKKDENIAIFKTNMLSKSIKSEIKTEKSTEIWKKMFF